MLPRSWHLRVLLTLGDLPALADEWDTTGADGAIVAEWVA